jgi:E3 ubiquitin-protein ligase NEDD4
MYRSLPLSVVHLTNSTRDNDITDILDLTFSTEDDRFGETVVIDLKPNGRNIEVTNANKKEYIE